MRRASPATSSSTCSAAVAGSRAPPSTASARGSASRAPPLDRLLAEIVLRPPDLRHLDAAVQALAASARRESSLKTSITDRFASRCATCERPVTLDEITWSTESEGEDGRPHRPPADAQALPLPGLPRPAGRRRAAAGPARRQRPAARPRPRRRRRPGVPARPVPRPRGRRVAGRRAARPPHAAPARRPSPRSSSAWRATSGRPRSPRRSGSRSSTRSGPASRLATSPGRVAPLRIAGGHVRLPGGAHWRERNPWLAFEDGVRLVRGFVQRLESGAWGPVPARLGDDLRGLVEGSATAMLKQGTSAALGALQLETARLAETGLRPRVRLVLGTPPLRPAAERLAWAYHTTAWVLGREAAATLPARAAVRARGPPVVGLAGGRRHPGAARRRADHGPQRPGRAAARGRRAGVPRRLRPGRRRRRLPPRGRPAAGGGSRDGRRRRAGPARLGRGAGRRPDPRERRAAAGPGRRRRPGHRARRAPVRAPGADRRRPVLARRTRRGPWSMPRSTSSSCAASR